MEIPPTRRWRSSDSRGFLAIHHGSRADAPTVGAGIPTAGRITRRITSSGAFGVPIATAVSPRILLAHNNGEARGLLAEWLQAAGFVCVPVTTADALPEARRHTPDVAIVAVENAEDGGMWVVRTLRAHHHATAVIVIACPPDFDVAVTASRLGAVDCLPGAPSQEVALDAVRRALLWREAVQAAGQSAPDQMTDEVTAGRTQLRETINKVDPDSAQSVLLAVLEARTPETHDHAHRVAQAAVALARRLGLSAEEIQDVKRAALLHDIGKIAIPTQLLAGTSPLTPEDIQLLREHVTIGAEVLASVPPLRETGRIVAATHERFDGTGYPAGLGGDDIPMAARIIAVADAFDALTGVRTYREPLSHDEANAELVRGAGTHLDPVVVRAWLRVGERARCC